MVINPGGRILGTQLTSRKEIRLDILTGLRNVIRTNLEIQVGNSKRMINRLIMGAFLPFYIQYTYVHIYQLYNIYNIYNAVDTYS